MKTFEVLAFDRAQCRKEVLELQALLAANPSLKERTQVLPFFKERKHLSAFIASYFSEVLHYDRLAHEYQLFGDFACDLVAGDSATKSYVFVEFEDAAPDSIFVKKKKKSTPEWSSRFEHGFSQVVDWLFKLDEQRGTVEFEERFGARAMACIGMLVVGREEPLGPREAARLRWRQEFVLVNSKHVKCVTFDQLCQDLLGKLQQLPYILPAEQLGD
jgi:Domain of unknown function (DUF4263)